VSKKARRSFTADQKAAIVRRHVFDKVPVSNLCDEYGIQPSMFYNWQKVLADNAARAFETEGRERGRPSREAELEQKIAQLEAKLAKTRRHREAELLRRGTRSRCQETA
jgi:transposase